MIRIVIDSASNLPHELRASYEITVVPLYVAFGTTSYRDEIDLTNERFLKMLEEGKQHPTTSQPTPADFVETYRTLLTQGHEIVSIHLSSKLSGTYASAVAAKKMLDPEFGGDAPISIVDTPFVSMGDGFLALEATRMVKRGLNRAEIVAMLEKDTSKINTILLLDTLEYLRRGGRIGRAQALMAGMLNVKPLIELKDGAIEPLERVRSRSAGLKRLLELVQERTGGGNVHATVLHVAAEAEAKKLEDDLRARFNIVEMYVAEVGPVIATHTGPGTLGIVFYKE